MSRVTFTAEGNRVVAKHSPSGDTWTTGTAATHEDAVKAADIITRGYTLNNARKYTASARMYARLDDIPGYHEED